MTAENRNRQKLKQDKQNKWK